MYFACMQGLVTKGREDIDPAAAPFAKTHQEIKEFDLQEGASLIEVVSITENLVSVIVPCLKCNMLCFN